MSKEPFFTLQQYFRDCPKRPLTEKEIRRAVDALWDSLGHKSGVDELKWKEERYATFTGVTDDERYKEDNRERLAKGMEQVDKYLAELEAEK